MSGHSKWSKVKHQKATTDAVKAREFTKASRAISIAVREGSGVTDPDHNFRLRLAIEKARGVNMPKENIARAIEKGKGSGVIIIPAQSRWLDSVMEAVLEAGGDDVRPAGLVYEVYTSVSVLAQVNNKLRESGFPVDAMAVIMKPKLPLTVSELLGRKIAQLQEELESLDDVQSVYTNLL